MTKRIILADNSPAVKKILEMAFPGPDYEVKSCQTSEELWLELEARRPDALILSLSLPGDDVYELLAKINSRPELADLPLVLLKNAFEPVDEVRLASLVYSQLVTKPFDSEKVAGFIKKMLGEQEPESLPEEPEAELPASPLRNRTPDSGLQDIHPAIRSFILEEIMALERELEKRITASLRNEFKSWLEASLSRLKGKEKDE
jgi:DNA-binding response OmpR family regulator